ncbi:MAG: hypothetical protein JWM59_464 [Verrucomicrobiales bacterium]|nr:hypothetical protein [Verrucomicrobiales bacterium]
MQELSKSLYDALYSNLSLRTAGIAVGLALIVVHILALLRQEKILPWLSRVPRSQNVGTVFLTVGFLWAWMVATSMDLGEFQQIRWLAQTALPVFYVSMLFVANDYLGARAVGIILLLAACPVLDAAFLKPPVSRLLLSTLAYGWIVAGLFWVGMPFTMRNQIAWIQAKPARYRALCIAGVVYGILVLVSAVLFYGVQAVSPA